MIPRTPNSKGEMPFLDHLEELRWRILWSVLALFAGALGGFVVVQRYQVLELLVRPVRPYLQAGKLLYFSPVDGFFVTLKVGVLLGLILVFPILVYQVWAFLSPALEKREKRVIVPSLYLGLVLFAAGVAMAYFIALPVTLKFLVGFQTEFLEASYEINAYMAFVLRLLLAFGIVFELPVVVMILSALGLVTPTLLRNNRRYALVIITIVACILSPGDVVVVSLLMMVPLTLLYEVSILLSRMIYRRKEENSIISQDPPEGAVQVKP